MTAATFQSTVFLQQGLAVVGDVFDSGPRIALPYTLVSALASYNVFGRGFSITGQGIAAAGNAGGALPFAGILVNPKAAASIGDSSSPLNPTLTLQNNQLGELMTEGSCVVTLPGAAAIGDLIVYDNTTGILSSIIPSATIPVGTSPAYAFVSRFTVSGAGPAVITLNPTITYA